VLAQPQNKLVDLIVLKIDGIFKHELLGQYAHRKAQVLAGVLCVEVLQGFLALAHVGTGRHWLTPMRKDVLEDAASQFVACTAGSSGMTRLETFPTHQAALGLIHSRPGADKRIRIVSLTNKGRKLVEDAEPKWRQAQEALMQTIGEDRWRAMRTLLRDTTRMVRHRTITAD